MIDPRLLRRLQRVASGFNARARRWHAPGVVSWRMLVMIDEKDEHACHYCRSGLGLSEGTWDHHVPFDGLGTNDIMNIVRCCVACQRRKFNRPAAELLEHNDLVVTCARPGCGNQYRPRWAEWQRGVARFCSHACAGMAKGHPEWTSSPSVPVPLSGPASEPALASASSSSR